MAAFHAGRKEVTTPTNSLAALPVVQLSTRKEMDVTVLTKVAKQLDVPGASGLRKQ